MARQPLSDNAASLRSYCMTSSIDTGAAGRPVGTERRTHQHLREVFEHAYRVAYPLLDSARLYQHGIRTFSQSRTARCFSRSAPAGHRYPVSLDRARVSGTQQERGLNKLLFLLPARAGRTLCQSPRTTLPWQAEQLERLFTWGFVHSLALITWCSCLNQGVSLMRKLADRY